MDIDLVEKIEKAIVLTDADKPYQLDVPKLKEALFILASKIDRLEQALQDGKSKA